MLKIQEKKIKLTSKLIRYLNPYRNLSFCIQCNENMPMLVENDTALDYSMHYKKEEYPLGNKKQEDENN